MTEHKKSNKYQKWHLKSWGALENKGFKNWFTFPTSQELRSKFKKPYHCFKRRDFQSANISTGEEEGGCSSYSNDHFKPAKISAVEEGGGYQGGYSSYSDDNDHIEPANISTVEEGGGYSSYYNGHLESANISTGEEEGGCSSYSNDHFEPAKISTVEEGGGYQGGYSSYSDDNDHIEPANISTVEEGGGYSSYSNGHLESANLLGEVLFISLITASFILIVILIFSGKLITPFILAVIFVILYLKTHQS
jgi:hypothetical protein